ncbi:MAG TPA: ABC transporter ATP-binding protein [Solirubrobacteraceae bacterium]|nr:ABC transporter ATP-binding protein [Solirubrobacteraceae bacterium]
MSTRRLGLGLPARWSRVRVLLGYQHGTGLIAALTVSSVLTGLTESAILGILTQVATALVGGTSNVHVDAGPIQGNATIGALIAVAFGLAVLRLALQVVVSWVPPRVAADTQARLRNDLFDAFTGAPWGVQSRDREGHLQELLTDQVATVAHAVLFLAMGLGASLIFVVLIISAFVLNAVAALAVLVAAVGLFFLMRPLGSVGTRHARELSTAQMDYASGIGEAVRLAVEVEAFGVVDVQRGRFARFVDEIRRPYFQTQFLVRLGPALYQSSIYLILAAGLGLLALINAHHVALLGAVILLLIRAGIYGQEIQANYQGMRQTLPYVDRVQAAMERYAASTRRSGGEPLASIGALAFENVSFAYEPGQPVLREVAFEVAGGEAIGVIGPSGAGKSTLVQILLGLRSPTDGRYLVNGTPADRFAQPDWHRLVAYVPQDPQLLYATVAENIRFMRDIDDEAVRHAAQLAGIHDEIMTWPAGYETVVGPRANAVSGGQQQRICVARALAARPQMLILDEPTSALDPHSELAIRESLLGLKHELTLFVVAHRLSTLDICERIMVIRDGRLEAFATAESLQSTNTYYRSALQIAVGASDP